MTAKPETKQGKGLTAVWIIPIVAAVLGMWMVAYNYLNEGPEIEITFNNASGLEEGKTKVKFRDVEIGMLQEVRLDEDLEGVTAVVKLRKEAEILLNEDTRFWVVRARVGDGGVSGLDTILSGAYLTLSPGQSLVRSKRFVGLETPPLTPADAPGLRLVLVSTRSVSLSSGDTVLHNGFPVGRVESVTFDPDTQQIRHVVFIDAPYHNLVDSSVRFWDTSGISLSAGAAGVELQTGSLDTIVRGGVAFAQIDHLKPGNPVEPETEFELFSSYGDAREVYYTQRLFYAVAFKQSLKGLENPGAPIEYRGIRVGRVERILFQELIEIGQREGFEPRGGPIPVLISIEPARLALPDTVESLDLLRVLLEEGVRNGLRATLVSGNLITGAQIVQLEYFENAEPAEMGEFEGIPEIPTVAGGLGQISDQVVTLLEKANALPLEQTVASVNRSLEELNRSMTAMRKLVENENTQRIPDNVQDTIDALRMLLEDDNLRDIPADTQETIAALRAMLESEDMQRIPTELKGTLSAARFQLQGQTPEIHQLGKTLKEVESAARALREFLDTIEKKPESLIRGKSDTGQ